MTEVTWEERDGRARVRVSGHAGFNPGRDIVCASISAITYQLINALVDMEKEGQVRGLSVRVRDGECDVALAVPEGHRVSWEAVRRMALTGYRNIEDVYPEYIKIEEVRA